MNTMKATMIARTIDFNVDVDGITPQGEQFGGLQGEHKATELVFNISQELIEKTVEVYDGDTLGLTLQVTDGAGGYHEYDLNGMDFGATKTFQIPNAITLAGGTATFCLVFSDIAFGAKPDQTEAISVIYSFPFKLRFKDTLTVGTPSQQEFFKDGASILESAKQYTEETRILKEETQTLVENANNTLDDLNNSIVESQETTSALNDKIILGRATAQALQRNNTFAEQHIEDLENILGNTDTVLEELNNIEEALDRIIAIQESYIGGGN